MGKEVGSRGWAAHLATAEREGKSIRRYANERGLSPWSLYDARRRLRSKAPEAKPGALAVRPMPLPFAAVALKMPPASTSSLLARLPNGVQVELRLDPGDAVLLSAAVAALAGLPCSA